MDASPRRCCRRISLFGWTRPAERLDRSKSWIVREALVEWLAEDQRRYELTLEALKDIDGGRTISLDEVMKRVAEELAR
jgi:predicted transcriptional regulator